MKVISDSKTILLTGLPRSGTTLCCHILNDYPNVLALHEPLTPSTFADKEKFHAINAIKEFAEQTRIQVLQKGTAISRQKDGVVPENPVAAYSEKGLRQLDVNLGEINVGKHVQNADFTLVIKHNALFTALLPELQDTFPVYGIVRNPLAVLSSWNSVDLPVNDGRIPAGEMFCPVLRCKLADTPDRIMRQLHILEWFCNRFYHHLSGRIMRYEKFVGNPVSIGGALDLKTVYSGVVSERKSRNDGYDIEMMELLYGRLKGFGDAIWEFYSRDQVDELMENIRSAA